MLLTWQIFVELLHSFQALTKVRQKNGGRVMQKNLYIELQNCITAKPQRAHEWMYTQSRKELYTQNCENCA